MIKFMEDFLSNKWNLYGIQVLACVLVFMMTHQFLPWKVIFVLGLCLYMVGICQRILGVRWGLLLAQLEKDRIGRVIEEIKKIERKRKK